MNECKHLFDIMNDVDDKSFDIVTTVNECTPPLNHDVECDNVQQVTDVQFDMEKFIADSSVLMYSLNVINRSLWSHPN